MNISSNVNQVVDSQAINRLLYGFAQKADQKMVNSQNTPVDTKEEDTKLADTSVMSKVDVDDIKSMAQSIGEEITNDDIKYGLTYGRSVIAEYIA